MLDNMHILKLELSGIREAVMHAMIQRSESLTEMIQKEMDLVLTPEFLEGLINKETKIVVAREVKNSIENYFSFGPGQEQIQKMVELRLQTNHESA